MIKLQLQDIHTDNFNIKGIDVKVNFITLIESVMVKIENNEDSKSIKKFINGFEGLNEISILQHQFLDSIVSNEILLNALKNRAFIFEEFANKESSPISKDYPTKLEAKANNILESLKNEKERQLEKQKKADDIENAKRLKENEKLELRIKKEQELEQAAKIKNETHDISISNGIKYCKYCGDTRFDTTCNRALGHRYTIKRVIGEYSSEYKPVCSKCGLDKWCYNNECR